VFTAEYFRSAYSDIATMDANDASPYPNNVSGIEYWDITRNSGGNAKVTLYWADSDVSKITDCTSDNDLIVAHFTSSEWRNANSSGTATITGSCSSSSGTIISDLQTTFSPFTFGSEGSSLNPLPIELLSFTAQQNGSVVDLNWETVSEINNDYFTIERSEDAIDFETIATVGGAGNSSNKLNYGITDFAPLLGVSYYRLKQTDYDGKYEFSNIEAVNFTGEEKNGEPSILIFPNPSKGSSTINALLTNFSYNSDVKIVLRDNLSREYFTGNITTNAKGTATLKLNSNTVLAAAIYFVTAYGSNGEYVSETLIVTR
jgi:hypothetical protein